MSHGTTPVEGGPVKNSRGEVSVETKFGEKSLHGGTLDAATLLESQIGGNEAVRDAGEPDVPVGSVGLRPLQIGVPHGVGPFKTLREEMVVLIVFGSRGSFEVSKALLGIMTVTMLDDGGNMVLISELDKIFSEFSSRSEMCLAVFPMPVKNVVEAFGEFQFSPRNMKKVVP